jgi:hypothetical protein
MDVWQFLAWLFAQINKVIDWFSDNYWNLKQGAENALDWAWNYANWALDRAKDWATGELAKLRVLAEDLYEAGSNYSQSLFSWLRNEVNRLYNMSDAALHHAKDYLSGLINDAYNRGVSFATSKLDGLKSFASGLVEGAKTEVKGLFNPLLVLKPVSSFLVSLANPANASKLTTLLGDKFETFVLFTKDPVRFILGLLWPKMTSFLCYLLAYGFGTVKDDLPPVPDWTKDQP